MHGKARRCKAWVARPETHGTVWLRRHGRPEAQGIAWLDAARIARHRAAGPPGHREGSSAGHGGARRSGHGAAVIARPGRVRLGGPGSARPVLALQGWAWVAWRGRKGPEGRAKRCEAKPGEAGLARRGLGCRAGHGSSRRGSHGVVLQRMDSSARHGPAVKARLGKSWPGLGSAAGGQGAAHRGAGGSARQRVAGQCTAVPARNGAVPRAWHVRAVQARRGAARAVW